MFIKRVHAQNFVSYKELQMPQELHPGCNLILGYNGSGKSNFLQAIIFALSDLHSKKTKQERALMLNNRSATREYTVEIVLDNSKQKIPVAGNEIIVKKTYNCDTDKEVYFLNGSHIHERELFNLFESGGFSLSGQSQFQIVQQGQVEQLVLQGEEGFLKMLKEVTGTESFDSRVEKMNSVLGECKTKKEQLEKILESIKGRLDQLGQEIEEYREIQKIERQKKALELALHTTKTQINNVEIEKLRHQRGGLMEERQSIINQREDFLIENSNQKENIDQLKGMIQLLETKIQNLNQMRNEILNSKVDSEQFAHQRKEQKTLYDYFSTTYDQQLQQLGQGVQILNEEIQSLQVKSNILDSEISKIKQKQSDLVREKDLLLMKKETIEKFKNPQQRKKFFQDESGRIQVQLASINKDKEDAAKNLDSNKKRVQDMTQKVQAKTQEMESLKTRIKEAEININDSRDDKKKVASQLKAFMFQQGELELEIKALKTKYMAEVETLERLDPVYSTLKRLRSLIADKQVRGYKGLLIDFIECDSRFSACVDLAAKSKLFSLIVDDLDTAKEILALNNQIKGGVINIYPLSVLGEAQEKQRSYPESNEIMPLFKQIKLKENADPRIAKLIYNIFSKVVLVKNYQLAMEIARDHNLTCVTPDLQIVYAGAFITKVGQYNKSQSDRVGLYRKVQLIQGQVEQKIANQMQLERERDKLSDKDLDAMRQIQKADITMNNLKSSFQQNNSILFELNQQIDHKQQSIKEQLKVMDNLSHQEQQAQEQLKDLEKESQSQAQSFSDQDSNRLLFLNKTLDELHRQLQVKETERNQFNNQLQQTQNMLNENYLKRQNDLQQQILEQEIESNILDKKSDQTEHKVMEREIQDIEREIQIYQTKFDHKTEELQNVLQQIEVQGDNEVVVKDLRSKTVEIEEVSMKIDEVQGKNYQLETLIKKIEMYDKELFDNAMKDFNQQSLVQQITLKAIELEKFPRMNRHCVEWYDKYSAKHQDLKKKFDDQIETESGIFRLLVDLDSQKQQALERNFMKLNENFNEIFSRIVPNGRAEMRLIKKDQEDESQISHPSQFQEGSQIMKIGQQLYKGIKVRVSFSGQNNQLEGLGHLSGGQKAVVAAALLFAILKIEAAPFYIMDEFDNALDAEFRGAIAGLIFELSKQSQFLITTFKPELIEGADKIYQVKTKNNASEIREIDQKKAYDIMNKNDK